jgi:hypothetical protein|tara:strand:- start:2020 stop:2403 length:384 start_codon:yes stop_codon:yes gene_type:complete
MQPHGHLLVLDNIYGDVEADKGGYIRTNISSEKWKYLLKAEGMEIADVGTHNHWGVVLTESIQSLLAKISWRKPKPIEGSRGLASVSKVDSSADFKKILRKLVFAVPYVLDYVPIIPILKAWRRYEI